MKTQDQTSLVHVFGGLFLWGVLYVIIHLVHFRFFIVDVVFYAAFFDVFVAAALWLVLYFMVLKKRLRMSKQSLVLGALLGLTCGYSFAITVPTVVDRSLSAYILEKLVQRGGGVQENALEQIFIQEYIPEYKLMEVRLQEALSSGTVVAKNGCIVLTPKGRRVAGMTQLYRKNFLPKKRRLLGVVSDDLLNPLKDGVAVDYLCPSNKPAPNQ